MDYIDKKNLVMMQDKIEERLDKLKKLKLEDLTKELEWCDKMLDHIIPRSIKTKSEELIKYHSKEKLEEALKNLNLEVATNLEVIKYKQEVEKRINQNKPNAK